MVDGFGAVLDELRQAAGRIDDVISGVPGKPWRGPSGDYGHAGVQQGWAQFIENARREVENLHRTAAEHGERLREAAAKYLESEAETGGVIGRIGDLLDGGSSGLDPRIVPGGGFTGGIRNVVDGPADDGAAGRAD